MYKEDLKCSSAELVYGQTLRLPGDLCADKANSYAEEVSVRKMISSLKSFASQCRPIDTRVAQILKMHMPHSLHSCVHVFVKNDPIKSNLTPTYDGPFEVLLKTEKTFTISRGIKQQSVAIIDIVKPAYCSSSSFEEPPVAETFPTPQNSTRLPRQSCSLLDFVTT